MYGYDAGTGEKLFSWQLIHPQPITSMVFLCSAERRLFVTAGRDGSVKVWRVRGKEPDEWNLQLLRTVGDGSRDRQGSRPHVHSLVSKRVFAQSQAQLKRRRRLTAAHTRHVLLYSTFTRCTGTRAPLQYTWFRH